MSSKTTIIPTTMWKSSLIWKRSTQWVMLPPSTQKHLTNTFPALLSLRSRYWAVHSHECCWCLPVEVWWLLLVGQTQSEQREAHARPAGEDKSRKGELNRLCGDMKWDLLRTGKIRNMHCGAVVYLLYPLPHLEAEYVTWEQTYAVMNHTFWVISIWWHYK